MLTARRYAAFRNTDGEDSAKLALSPDFFDRTLPDGRSQGPPPPPCKHQKAFARTRLDAHAGIDDLLVTGSRASVHLHFQGHFTGSSRISKPRVMPSTFRPSIFIA